MNVRGVSLLEVVVATLMLTVGLLGAAAVMATAVRAAGDGTLGIRAVALGAGRREMLVAGGCAPGSGSSAAAGVRVSWSVDTGAAPESAPIRIVVERRTARGLRTDTMLAWCSG